MARDFAALPLQRASFSRVAGRMRLFLDEEREPSSSLVSRSRWARFASRLALAVAVAMLVSVGGLLAVRASFSDKIYPSVFVAHVDVGGLTRADADAALATEAEAIAETRITLHYGDRSWTPTFQELGFTIDTQGSLDGAYGVGREPDARNRVRSAFGLAVGETIVPILVTHDDAALERWFDDVDEGIGEKPRAAKLVIEDGKVTVKPDADGTVVERSAAKEIIFTSVKGLQAYSGPLPIVDRPSKLRAEDLAGVKADLEQALAEPVKLTHKKKTWTLTGSDLGRFVVQDRTTTPDGTPTLAVSLDEKALASWLVAMIGEDVNRDPRDAVIAWGGESVISVEKSAVGLKLKPLSLTKGISESFFGDHKPVKVPVSIIEPRVDSSDLDSLGITNRLAVGDSSFEGSDASRFTNISVGVSLLNGTLIPPGEDFSFNRSIGEITADLGYVESSVVDGERVGKDIGGGICQVSTTVFRAAFLAGLPITEWHPHRYRLGYYELDGWQAGLDASILQPEGRPFEGGDFRFHNPTDSWMLVESYIDGPRVIVILYGPELGYDVQVSEPWISEPLPPTDDIEVIDNGAAPGTVVQTEWPMSGLDVSYQRTVYDRKGNVVLDEPFATHFYARGNVYKVSPDMQGQSPASN